jgi:hypothetical protein
MQKKSNNSGGTFGLLKRKQVKKMNTDAEKQKKLPSKEFVETQAALETMPVEQLLRETTSSTIVKKKSTIVTDPTMAKKVPTTTTAATTLPPPPRKIVKVVRKRPEDPLKGIIQQHTKNHEIPPRKDASAQEIEQEEIGEDIVESLNRKTPNLIIDQDYQDRSRAYLNAVKRAELLERREKERNHSESDEDGVHSPHQQQQHSTSSSKPVKAWQLLLLSTKVRMHRNQTTLSFQQRNHCPLRSNRRRQRRCESM